MKNYLLILVSIFFLNNSLIGQTRIIDSLKANLINLNQDTLLVENLNRISDNLWKVSSFDSALKYAFIAKQLSVKLKHNPSIAYSENNIGVIYEKKGDYRTAIKHHLEALKLRTEMNNKKAMADSYLNIGIIYKNEGDYSEAYKNQNSALKLMTELNNKKGIARANGNIAILQEFQGNLAAALNRFSLCLKTMQELGDKRGVALSYMNIGSLFVRQGNYTEALKNIHLSLKIQEELNDKMGIASSYIKIGTNYLNQQKYSESLKSFSLALTLSQSIGDKSVEASALDGIGNIYFEQKKYIEALKYYQDALKVIQEMGSKLGAAAEIGNIGATQFMTGNNIEAKKSANLSLKQFKEIGYFDGIRNNSFLLAKITLKDNNFTEAELHLEQALKIAIKQIDFNFSVLSESEQELFLKTLQYTFDFFGSFALMRIDKNPSISELIYNNTLRNKGLTLKSSTAMRNAILSSEDTLLIKDYEEWKSLKKKISKLFESGMDSKEQESKANELEKELVKKSETFSNFNKLKNLEWKQVQKGLKKDEVALEFAHFKNEIDTNGSTIYAALIINSSSKYPEMIRLFEEKDLIKILGTKTETGTDYITNLYGKKDKSNSQLYNLIWKPMEKSLRGVKTIYYSPSGLLHKISFAALSKSQDVFLCDNHRLELQGSTGKLAMPEKFEFTNESTIGIYGDINYDTPESLKDTTALLSWSYLEGTKTESEKVAAILKTNNFKYDYVAGKNATETEFKNKAPQNNIVHIATHGFFFPEPDAYTYAEKQDSTNKETQMYRGGERAVGIYNFIINKNPLMRSGLVFAGANEVWSRKEYIDKEDGVVTAQEVAIMDLHKTNLVVLSACETGLGDVKGTEGVYGLQRSLKMAGVKFMIMSLWQVPDAETVEFMEKFYTKLTKTKDIKTSFYETRNEMRKKYDPFYWAAFVLLE